MALEGSNELVMPVGPLYNNGGGWGNFGGDWSSLIVLFLIAAMFGGFGGGWGNMGGFNNAQLGYDFPWLLNGQQNINANTNEGFRDVMLNDGITSIKDGINGISNQLCNGFAGVEQGANARQVANMQSIFGVQSALQECCCENRANIADLKYTVATENCADRTAAAQNTRDIIDSQTRGTQAILDKLCQLELDGIKAQVDAKNDRIVDLQNQLNMATLRESQVAQNAFIQQGLTNEVDALYNRLSNCPVPTTPVYGRTPIFTCNQNQGCGCGNF